MRVETIKVSYREYSTKARIVSGTVFHSEDGIGATKRPVISWELVEDHSIDEFVEHEETWSRTQDGGNCGGSWQITNSVDDYYSVHIGNDTLGTLDGSYSLEYSISCRTPDVILQWNVTTTHRDSRWEKVGPLKVLWTSFCKIKQQRKGTPVLWSYDTRLMVTRHRLYISSISHWTWNTMMSCNQGCTPTVATALYSIGSIDTKSWRHHILGSR